MTSPRQRYLLDVTGILPVDKPEGISTFDVIRALGRHAKTDKVGHTGTLDPFASGLVVICLNRATKVAGLLTDKQKTYRATVLLGQETDSSDREGAVVAEGSVDPATVSDEAIIESLSTLRGTIMQVPPLHSALKVDGVRAYKLARRGSSHELPPREVVVHEIELVDRPSPELLDIEVTTGPGVYIRSIARDLGRALGTLGHLIALRRTRSGRWSVDDTLSLEAFEDEATVTGAVISLDEALGELPSVALTDEMWGLVGNGVILDASDERIGGSSPDEPFVFVHGASIVALGASVTANDGRKGIKMRRLLAETTPPRFLGVQEEA